MHRERTASRRGFTLIEALIAVAVTMIMMLAMTVGFASVSQTISDGRARLTLSDQLRGVTSLLREDLEALTAGGDPLKAQGQTGYFEYYEGPLNDFTASLASYVPDAQTVEERLSSSRYGDFDDILSFTARARAGQWFYGDVPYPIVAGQIDILSDGVANFTYSAEEWARSVTVAADTAEIIYFVSPWGADPAPFIDATTGAKIYPVNSTNEPLYTDDDTSEGIPDRLALCRRVLLVLPSLNLPEGATLPSGTVIEEPQLYHDSTQFGNFPYPAQMLADPLLDGSGNPLPLSFRRGMQNAYQRCDISVRRVADESGSTPDPVAANTLADLQDPRNRFGRVMLPINSTDTTMPLWSLTGPVPLQQFAATGGIDNTAPLAAAFGGSVAGGGNALEVGFLRPEFLRQRRIDNVGAGSINWEVGFSEVLATNCVAFDVRLFDSGVRSFYHPGSDGLPGAADTDDNQFGPTDMDQQGNHDLGELGFIGTDDVVVTPSDPAFPVALEYSIEQGALSESTVAKRAEFVDVGWTLKNYAAALSPPFNYNKQGFQPTFWTSGNWAASVYKTPSLWGSAVLEPLHTSMSATTGETRSAPPPLPVTDAMFKSGKAVVAATGNSFQFRVYQPGFDTFTQRYENDGYHQENHSVSPSEYGVVWRDGVAAMINSARPNYDPDADRGTNGVDDPVPPGSTSFGGGPDDSSEKETSPPITSTLAAIQTLVRLEDEGAAVIQQLAVTKDLEP